MSGIYEFHEYSAVSRVLAVEADDLAEAEEKHARGEYELKFTDVNLEPAESDWELSHVREPDDEVTR